MKQSVKFEQRYGEFVRNVSDYLRYTFTPSLGLMLLVATLAEFGIMTVLLYRFQPVVAVVIFCSHTIIFSVVMLLSFLHWKRYKGFYKVVNK